MTLTTKTGPADCAPAINLPSGDLRSVQGNVLCFRSVIPAAKQSQLTLTSKGSVVDSWKLHILISALYYYVFKCWERQHIKQQILLKF